MIQPSQIHYTELVNENHETICIVAEDLLEKSLIHKDRMGGLY